MLGLVVIIVVVSIFVFFVTHPKEPTQTPHKNNQPVTTDWVFNERNRAISEQRLQEINKLSLEAHLREVNKQNPYTHKQPIIEESLQDKIKCLNNEDKRYFLLCCQTAQNCSVQVIRTLKPMLGGHLIINRMHKNAELFMKEFIIFCASYNQLFLDNDGRGYFRGCPKEDFHNGVYRLCKMWNHSVSDGRKTIVEKQDVLAMQERMNFYRTEIDFINKSQFGLPVNLLYPLFNPEKSIDYTKALSEIDIVDAIQIWGVIQKNIAISSQQNA